MRLSLRADARVRSPFRIAPRHHSSWRACQSALVALTAFLCGLSGSGPARATAGEAATLYQRFCRRCHTASGKGDQAAGVSGIPDFTNRAWQTDRSDAQLLVSILNGKAASMPAFRGRLTEVQTRALIAHIRAFGPKRPMPDSPPSDFEATYRKLDEEMQKLKRESEELKSSPGDPEKPPAVPRRQDGSTAGRIPPKSTAHLYRQHCQRCHGEDGKGDGNSEDGPPNFTRREWQQRQSDAKLLSSILDGKGKQMPAFHKRLSEEQANDLLDYIRAFTPPRQRASRRKD